MEKHEAKISFWESLQLFLDEAELYDEKELKFAPEAASDLVELYDAVGCGRKLTVEKLEEAFNHSRNEQLYMEEMVEMAFADLAPHLRDPRARKLVEEFISHGGMDGSTDVFVHVKNVRFLDDENASGSPVVVTLVANSMDYLRELFNMTIEHVHASYSPKDELIAGNACTEPTE